MYEIKFSIYTVLKIAPMCNFRIDSYHEQYCNRE
jgi:hypothetical protein